ncbi:hypothetical protein V8G54_026416 [Vigna mungo]|uniref:Uncharacterized protein n=1 Tax=Vigna mungo TaxID=3915 RepID=A0AAQ3RN62_VIGMU
MAEVPSDSVAPGLSMRYEGNFESFKVEEQVALCGAVISAHITALEDFLEQALEALKVVVFVNVLTKLKLDDLAKALAGFLAQAALESVENFLGRFLKSEPD